MRDMPSEDLDRNGQYDMYKKFYENNKAVIIEDVKELDQWEQNIRKNLCLGIFFLIHLYYSFVVFICIIHL